MPYTTPLFSFTENRHTDGSVQFDIYQRGSDQRLASAATTTQADALCQTLNSACSTWEASNFHNTVDA